MTHDPSVYRRATAAAVFGLLAQVVLATAVLIVGFWARNPAIYAATWHFYGGALIWAILALLYNQQRLEGIEALESERLARLDEQGTAIFRDHSDDLDLARRRLKRLNTWGLWIVSAIIAAYLMVVGGSLLYANSQLIDADKWAYTRLFTELLHSRASANPTVLMVVMLGIAFVCFILARYMAGMTKVREWQLLRGGAAYLMGNAVSAILIAVGAVIFAATENRVFLAMLALVIPGVMLLVGVETLLSLLLGAYRPRRADEIGRPAFDSRILGWLTSPESIGRIFSEAVNYQFGFEVSRSWFYRLLGRAMTPMIVFAVLVLIAISSIVLVGPQQQGIVTRFGQIAHDKPLEPGVHLKLPWPFSRATLYPVGQTQQIEFGSVRGGLKRGVPLLWTNPHSTEGPGAQEEFLVTAPSPSPRSSVLEPAPGAPQEQEASGMGLVGLQVFVQYQIVDLMKYITHVENPTRTLTAISERRVSAFVAGRDIDTLLSEGKVSFGDQIKTEIQKDADAYDMGVKIMWAAMSAIHPPQDEAVADAFLMQIGALQERQSAIEQAQRRKTETLAAVAGSRDQAQAIINAIEQLRDLREERDQLDPQSAEVKPAEEAVEKQAAVVERLVAEAGGQASQVLFDAIAYSWNRSISERGKADRFKAELMAYRNAPDFYRHKRYYEVLAQGMAGGRKYIIAADTKTPPVLRIDLKDSGSGIDWMKTE